MIDSKDIKDTTNKNISHSMGYKPTITYIDEYDSSYTISNSNEENKQTSLKPEIHNPTTDIQDNFDKIDVFLPGLNDDIRTLIEGVYLPLKDYWEEIKDLDYGSIPKLEETTIIDNNISDSFDDSNNLNDDFNNSDDNYEEDDDLPPLDVFDDDKIDGLAHIIEIEHPISVIVDKEYAKNTKDLFDHYTKGLLDAISNYWVQAAPIIMGKSLEYKEYVLNDFKSYKKEDNNKVLADKKHMLDFAVRTEITRQNKIAFLQKMFPTDETILKLRNYKASYELRKKYANIKSNSEHTKEASDHNALLKASMVVYDNKYDNSFLALYKYFNSANKTLNDMFTLSIQEQKAKQYLK